MTMNREEKMKIVISNYFKKECSVNTSIREAFEKGFRIGTSKVQKPSAERVGHWTKRTTVTSNGNTYYSYECSECGDHHGTMWKYCPHCGAKMKGEEE